ncbi:MAG: ribonuclease HI [Alphaproteobacteria bacterium]|nr:ribonuclease HI [Alphaproteobacteria bacterium]
MNRTIKIYTDGSCLGNPGPGGWGAIIILPTTDSKETILSGGDSKTTNNRMEAIAVLEAMNWLVNNFDKDKFDDVELFIDSKYVINAIDSWLKNWKLNNWRTASKKPVKNRDLWEKLDLVISKVSEINIPYKLTWIKGHSNDLYNDTVDEIARTEAEKYKFAN